MLIIQIPFFLLQSEGSLSSEGSGLSAGGSSGSTTEDESGGEVACSITLIERLIRSHPIWFLPGIQRAGAFHLLQGKEEGVSAPPIAKCLCGTTRCDEPYIYTRFSEANSARLYTRGDHCRYCCCVRGESAWGRGKAFGMKIFYLFDWGKGDVLVMYYMYDAESREFSQPGEIYMYKCVSAKKR